MVTAALRSVFAQQSKEAVLGQWDQVSAMLAAKFPRAAELMAKASEDVLAFRHFPSQHWKKVWSTNLLEGRRMVSAESMVEIPALEEQRPGAEADWSRRQSGVANNQGPIQTNDLTSHSSGFIVKKRGKHEPRE